MFEFFGVVRNSDDVVLKNILANLEMFHRREKKKKKRNKKEIKS